MAAIQERFIGAWRLVSMEGRLPNGEVIYPYGRQTNGLVIYSADGWMSAHLFRPDRPRVAAGDLGLSTADEARLIAGGSVCYFGRYEIDENAHTVTHTVAGSLLVNWEGGRQRRFYEFSGDRLILTTPPIAVGGQESVHALVWERAG